MSDNKEFVAAHKMELDEQAEQALKEDSSVHTKRLKNAQKAKEENIADKQEMITNELQMEHGWHENSKEVVDREKAKVVKKDTQMHAAQKKHAAHAQEELVAAKKDTETERLEHARQVHSRGGGGI